MTNLVEYVLDHWPSNFTDKITYTVGLSGGIDSVVLLHVLHEIKNIRTLNLNAIHINHGISSNSDSWEKFCQDLCHNLNISLTTNHYTITKLGGESIENNARILRYQSFFKTDSDVIVLAHHQNDQIETVLSQIFRGSDLHNVAGMHEISTKQNKTFWRPLLNVPKETILSYAKAHNLKYVNDESNFDIKYLRNFIRQEILPLLLKFDENIPTKILNIHNQLQNTMSLIDEVAKSDLHIVLKNESIDLEKFKELTFIRQVNLLSFYIKTQGLALPSHKKISEFTKQATTSKWDSKPQIKLNEIFNLIKHKNKIYIHQ